MTAARTPLLPPALAGLARPELALVALMATIIAMLIIPLPTLLVDALIGLNIAIAVVIFLSSFYVERIIGFSTFPSVLLFTTILRLALSVSTSRLILVDADAGEIISAFGNFVVADNLVVGFVIFAIVTIVQFIVITKGSERVGEVVARFSLDGMPGKQMSIDADLRAGSITSEQAQQRRRDVERESQLYGSYDGAMKFVKGDAIAGIIITFVNLFGGVAVGMWQHGMGFGEALSVFALLTVGDGLVAQIPALLICISAGFVVTRVSGESRNLGSSILGELLGNRLVLTIAAVLVGIMGLLPGFPLLVFAVIAAGLGYLAYHQPAFATASDAAAAADAAAAEGGNAAARKGGRVATETLPLLLTLPADLLQQWKIQGHEAHLLDALFLRTGLQLGKIGAEPAGHDADIARVYVNEVLAVEGALRADHSRLLGDSDELIALGVEPQVIEHSTGISLWIPDAQADSARRLGCHSRTARDELERLLLYAVTRNITELFGIQETKQLLDEVEKASPELLKEVYRHVPVQRIAEVLQRLLREQVSIRNMRGILEALAQWGQREKDVITLVEHVRTALARYISDKASVNGRLFAMVLSPQHEDCIRSGIRQGQDGAFLNLDPAQSVSLLDTLSGGIQPLIEARPEVVLLVPPDIRRYAKRFLEGRHPQLLVMSYGEVSETVTLEVLKTL
ncbi:EscV/YscV/HrcV family type III secretion system export apparatus protein [Stenotrophomonas sp. B1-1]|uniref:EscV/YscV/HrcV family type III secretion system export apparatus protein n=1 Tax=Stenotrophomonas sp. B1-1 TaxID=2710648 RepID=UPI0013D8E62F|nr:EscV/YscV/HrcV family type III secretion system export apparatus protein [Stenotrophomonas sp. B1-1]